MNRTEKKYGGRYIWESLNSDLNNFRFDEVLNNKIPMFIFPSIHSLSNFKKARLQTTMLNILQAEETG